MRKLLTTFKVALVMIFIGLGSQTLHAQCSNPWSFGNVTLPGTTGGTNMIGCQYPSEYGQWNTGVANTIYSTSSTVTTDYLTVREGSPTGPVVAHGPQPLTWIAPSANTYYIHVTLDAACTTGSGCRDIETTNNGIASPCSDPATAGSTVSSPATACANQPISLSLSGAVIATGQTYQWQNSPDGVTYTNIAGAQGLTYSGTQSATTYYQCIVTCGAGTPVISTPVMVTMNSFLNCYCASEPGGTWDEDITKVQIGAFSNTSSCSTTGGPGSSLNQYSNYTTTVSPINLARTATYGLSIDITECSGWNYDNGTKVYIDYNHNGDFSDIGEEVYASVNLMNGTHTETGTIVIPLGAMLGQTRMRVINSQTWDMSYITPCSSGDYYSGETEDYIVNILPAPTCPQPNNLDLVDATASTGEISWTAGGSESNWQISYGAPGFNVTSGSMFVTNQNPDTITGLPANSFYEVYVRAVCGAGDTSIWSGPITFNTFNIGEFIEWNTACPSSGFVDITSTGSALSASDDSETGVILPFNLYYQGTIITDITIGNNGGVLLGTLSGNIGYNMPSAGNGLYPYNQDLADPFDDVYYSTIGTAPNRKFIIEWSDVPYYWNGQDGSTFELIIEEGTNEIYYVYEDTYMGNTANDYGANAEIGIRGPQNINVSVNNNALLQNNSCVHFYYTDCPKPTNLVQSFLSPTEVNLGWTAGASQENEWFVEYGPAGFTPGTGTMITENTEFSAITGLTQLTDYTVYIYSHCANGDTSLALVHNFTTLPYCSNPFGIGVTSDPDTLNVSWSWTESSPIYPVTGFNIQYGMSGFALGSGSEIAVTGMNFADSIIDATLLGSGVYQVYLQAECSGTNDTSAWVGPISVVMPITNDLACANETLTLGTDYVFNNAGAGVSLNEVNVAPPATGAQTETGWVNSTLNGTLWYKFAAPASGSVRINCTAIPNYNSQAGVYSVTNCSDFTTYTLLAANDDDMINGSFAPNFTVCGLTPGTNYYVMIDKFNSTSGNFAMNISEISLNAGSNGNLVAICTGTSVSLFDGIANEANGGVWSSTVAGANASITTDSMFVSTGLAYTTFPFEYRIVDGCAFDTVQAFVKVYGPSSAGIDGVITVCRNEPFDLLSGLNGNVDHGGTWYDPSNVAMPSSDINAPNFPGQYNYDYIAGNGVCPDDTANVVVTVTNCNYLDISENSLANTNLFPNPTTGLIHVTFEKAISGIITLTDANGRQIMTNKVDNSIATEMNIADVQPGVYFVVIRSQEGTKTIRVVKQ